MRKLRAALSLLLSVTASASACTVCDSEVGEQLRAGIFDRNFWANLLSVVAPFPCVLFGVALVQRALFRSAKQDSAVNQ